MRCWKCNKEFYSENLSRTFCDECLERIPKTTATTDFVNLLHTEMYELKIANLEAKLAESEDKNKKLKDEVRKSNVGIANLKNQLKQVKEKLAEKDKSYKWTVCKLCEQEINQDKIDFCIEKLTKVKLYAQHIQGGLINYIEDLIKQLKEGK